MLLWIMGIYTSTLIFFLLIFCYRLWLFTPAPWFCFYFVIDHGYLHQHLDVDFVFILLSIMVIYPQDLDFDFFLFCYRLWLFTPAPWFSCCCYFVIDHDYLHQHLDFDFVFILLSIMVIYPQDLDFPFVVILLSIMAIYTSILSFLLLLFCYRSWLFTPAPRFSFSFNFVIDHDYLLMGHTLVLYVVVGSINSIILFYLFIFKLCI
jgi:hypothetical protein